MKSLALYSTSYRGHPIFKVTMANEKNKKSSTTENKKIIEDFDHETNIVAYASCLTNVGIPQVIYPDYGKRMESDALESEKYHDDEGD